MQETRHHIIQTILGHPEHLPSLSELAYYAQKSESAVIERLDALENHDLVAEYVFEESRNKRNLPSTFYGLTDRGLHVLDEFKYFRGVPVLRAVRENTVEPESIRRHQESPRPDLPTAVADALDFDEEVGAVDVPGDDESEPTFADEATEDEAGTFNAFSSSRSRFGTFTSSLTISPLFSPAPALVPRGTGVTHR